MNTERTKITSLEDVGINLESLEEFVELLDRTTYVMFDDFLPLTKKKAVKFYNEVLLGCWKEEEMFQVEFEKRGIIDGKEKRYAEVARILKMDLEDVLEIDSRAINAIQKGWCSA